MALRAVAVLCAVVIGAAGLSGCGQGNVFSLSVGDCFNGGFDGAEIADVEIVACNSPHGSEVYSLFDVPGSEWPGMNAVVRMAEEGCVGRFKGYVGLDYEYSEWYGAYLHPTEDSWKRLRDREITCVVQPEFGQVSWSARGSSR